MRTLDRLRNGKGFYLLDGVLIASIIFLVVFQRPSLQDYERRCRETADPQKKEKIALDAVDFLVRQSVPDSIAHQANQEVTKENLNLPADTLFFPEIPPPLNDSLAGLYDGLLAENLPKLYWMRRNQPDSVRGENFYAARKIAAQVDAYLNHSYWVPLMDFLDKADDVAWRNWRTAAKSANISRRHTVASRYELAQCAAIYGLQLSNDLPDRRLQLELYLRLQNALAEVSDSVFNIGFALADWISRESQRAGYFLRVVSTEFNCGNQLYLLGRYDEALEKFKNVVVLTQQWRYFPRKHMSWYNSEVMERIMTVLYELGDYSAMLSYMDQYGRLAIETRQKTLYYTNRGLAARLIGDFQTAEEQFKLAIECGKGDIKKNIKPDRANVWWAYLELGDLYLKYNLPEKALEYFNAAVAFVSDDEDFLSAERLSDYWLYMAEAFVRKNDMLSAEKALNEAKKQFIDSPILRVKSFFSAAQIHQNLGQIQEAAVMLVQAREICQHYGMTIYEIDAILQQQALSFKAPRDSPLSKYPVEELENLIAQINKSGGNQQLVHSLALAVEAASRARRYDQATQYANWLLQETEALSRLYDQEQRLIFFQHSIYEDVKTAIHLDIRQAKKDSALVKLDYVKSRALQRRLNSFQTTRNTSRHLPYADIEKLRKQLQSDEAIIDYMVTDDTLYAFVLTTADLQIFPFAIAKRELRRLVLEYLVELAPDARKKDDYNERIQQKQFVKVIQLSHALYNKLIRGVYESLEGINRLYIVPDEFLHLIPFNTLALQNSSETEFLIDHKAIMYLPAASLLFAEIKDTVANLLPKLGLLASVDSAMYGAEKLTACLTDLKNMRVTIRTHWENKKEFESCLARQYQAYFFYAHAEANWEDPWRSYIQFPLHPNRQYGKLTYADVDSNDWRSAALVILAGCETTGNRIYSGAGLSGLQRSFLGAGARQILATFWKVDAGQVKSQMSDFLEEWNRSGDAILALQRMQQVAISRLKTNPYLKYPHPRYWGAYNLTGTRLTAQISHAYAVRSVRQMSKSKNAKEE